MGQARRAAAAAGPRRAPFGAEAAQRHAIRFIQEPARAAAAPGEARRSRPDRRDDPGDRFRCRDGFGAGAGGSAMIDRARRTVRRAGPWRQRLIRSLLYRRNVDPAVKARVRVGVAMVAFLAIYAVIGGRLVMFAVGGGNHGARRNAAQDANATRPPANADRNREVAATDV